VCPLVQPDPPAPVIAAGSGPVAPLVSSVRTADPVVFITVDDGRDEYDDAATLLELARVPVTLFLPERYVADKYPYMRRLVEAGGGWWVEDHTYSHPNLGQVQPKDKEVCGPLDTYEREFGRRSTLFRPPYGNTTPAVQKLVRSCGMDAVILWRASMNNGVLATQGGPLRAGDIVLMHFRPDLRDNLLELFRVANHEGLRIGRLECYVGGDPRCGQQWR
jgi:peptidoglycan/xylan/chitin deacetylase (PgdA/CDA1 family)